MAPTQDAESNLGKRGITTASASESPGMVSCRDFHRPWHRTLLARTASTVGVMLLFALPASVVFSGKNYIFAKIPFLKQLGFRFPSNKSAVLAVDVDGLTIQSRDASADAIAQLERAAMEQLANLHRTYAAWAENHEDLSGSLLVRLRVDKSGTVVHVDSLAARLSNAIFTRIVLSELRRWSFPTAGGEPMEITMPLLFVPKGMDPSTVVHWERNIRVVEQNDTSPRAADRATILASALTPKVKPALSPTTGESHDSGIKRAALVKAIKLTPSKQLLPAFKTTQAVGLRNQPRYSAMRVHEIDADTELNVLENRGDWLKVQVTEAESVGFIRKEFLVPVN